MNPKWTALTAALLEEAAEEFSNHSCNDWEWPADWTLAERNDFLWAYHHWNVTPVGDEDWTPLTQIKRYAPLSDSGVMAFLASRLRTQ